MDYRTAEHWKDGKVMNFQGGKMSRSSLLINEPPLQLLPSLALAIGVDEAIVLQQIYYWINNPKTSGRIVDGEKWIHNTYEQWQEDNFPFWSVAKIRRIFMSLS